MKSWEITKKDIRLLTRNARALFVLLVLPMIFITIIGLTMGKLFGWRNTNQILRIGVVNSIAYDQIGGPGWDEDDDDAKPAATAGQAQSGDSAPKPATWLSRGEIRRRVGARPRGKNPPEGNRA